MYHRFLPVLLLLAGLLPGPLSAQAPDPCMALGSAYVAVEAVQPEGQTVVRVPWQGGPAEAPADLQVSVLQENGPVLTAGAAPPVTAAFVPPSAGGPAIDLTVVDRSRVPLGGVKTVRADWKEGEAPKAFCSRIRVLARQPNQLVPTWVVDDQPRQHLPASIPAAGKVQLQVTGQGLWQDVKLVLDERLTAQEVRLLAPTPQITSSNGTDVALFNVTLPQGGVTGAQYSLALQNEGWATPGGTGVVPLSSVGVRGKPPRFLPNMDDGGRYQVPSSAIAPTVTLRGQNFGYEADQLTVSITAQHPDTTTLLEPVRQTLARCATGEEDCLTITFPRPFPGVRRYTVHLKSYDGQVTDPGQVIVPSTARFDFTKIESESAVTNKQAVFAGRTAQLTLALPTSAPAGAPDSVLLDGRRVESAEFSTAPGVLRLKLPVPPLPDNADRVTQTLAVVYPDRTTGVGALTVLQLPKFGDPVVIYGLKPHALRIGGSYLADVSLGDGTFVKAQDVTAGTSVLLATLTSTRASDVTDRLPVTRLGEVVGELEVRILPRPPLSQVARWSVTDAPGCPDAAQPLGTPLRVPPGGALCIRIEPDERGLTAEVQDTVTINVTQEGESVGSEVRLGYRAVQGSQSVRVPLTGVEGGTRITVGVQPTTQEGRSVQGEARTRMSLKQRIGLFASVTALAFRLPDDKARAAEEEIVVQNVTDLAGQVGIFFRPSPVNRDYTLFVGAQRLKRRFCQGATSDELGLGVGVSIRSIFSVGLGIPLQSSNIPATCADLAEGEARPTVESRGFYLMLGAPVLKLLTLP